jgi:hypothetical protein
MRARHETNVAFPEYIVPDLNNRGIQLKYSKSFKYLQLVHVYILFTVI